MLTLFVLAVLLGHLCDLPVCCPFRVSWWAASVPLAASAIAAVRFADADRSVIADAIAGLFRRTVIGLVKVELRSLST
jgi:tellurite resistance protein